MLVPDPDFLADWAKEQGKPNDLAQLAGDPELQKTLSGVVDRVNRDMSNLEKVRAHRHRARALHHRQRHDDRLAQDQAAQG